jgi:BMFP domain-containing protein YqiC
MEPAMLSAKTFDEIAARIGQIIENSPAKDLEKNVKAMLASSLARLDLVPRAEFDVQAQVLLKTRAKLEALEKRLADLEERLPPPAA